MTPFDEKKDVRIEQISINRQIVNEWTKKWLVSFNPQKTKLFYVTLKDNKPISPVD